MKILLIAIATLLLASCDTKNSNTTYDVQYYLDNPDILKKTIENCRNNPGSLENTPNCINAEEASFKQMNENMKKAWEKLK